MVALAAHLDLMPGLKPGMRQIAGGPECLFL